MTPNAPNQCLRANQAIQPTPVYEVGPRSDKRRFDLIPMRCHSVGSGGGGPDAISIGDAGFYRRSHDAVIRVYDEAGNVIEMHEHGAVSRSHRVYGLKGSGKFYLVPKTLPF
jgi:hypothetical protein